MTGTRGGPGRHRSNKPTGQNPSYFPNPEIGAPRVEPSTDPQTELQGSRLFEDAPRRIAVNAVGAMQDQACLYRRR
jgi:hypothetical protein